MTLASKVGLGDLLKHPASINKPQWIELLDVSMHVNSLELEESRCLCLYLDPQMYSQAWAWCNFNWFKPGSSLVQYVTWMIFKTSYFSPSTGAFCYQLNCSSFCTSLQAFRTCFPHVVLNDTGIPPWENTFAISASLPPQLPTLN